MSISFVYHQVVARRQRLRPLLRLHRRLRLQPTATDATTDSHGYGNYYAERYSYRYAKADAHATIPTHTQTASHTGAPALTVTEGEK